MATTQPVTNFTFELEEIKNRVNAFAAAVGQDVKQLQNNTQPDIPVGKYTLTGSANANNLSGTGFYTASAGVVTTANNFPTTTAGVLTQVVFGSNKTQEYVTVTALKYVRGYNGSSWTEWRTI